MRGTASTVFFGVFLTELLFNLKRVAPYALMIIFSANAVLWWGWGPAVVRGWAVNSDFYIVWLLSGFSFMTMPLFIALMMGDPVIRDFRIGVDPLIFSKPVGRIEYLLGKFFANFFVLVCCQACFALTAFLLQAFSTPGMIVLSSRLLPYFQHFFFFVAVSSLALGAFYFTVGTLTRNVKIVYGLAVSFYPLYIAWQYTIKRLPLHWRVALDPLLFNVDAEIWKGRSADWLNQITISYDGYMIANRVLMIAFSLACLAVLYLCFSMTERAKTNNAQNQISILNLTAKTARLYSETGKLGAVQLTPGVKAISKKQITIPQVEIVAQGWRANFEQFKAAIAVEFRLLRAERSLVVVAPLVTFFCIVELAAYEIVSEVSYSAAYASRTSNTLLLFLFGVAVFYTGETIHRDRETRIEPVLWSMPAPNFVILLSKFAAMLLLSISLITIVASTAIGLQIYKGHAPLQLQTYLTIYAVVLVPGVSFMIAASVALNILLRDKYLTYAISLAIGGATYYLTGQSHNSWLYNPVLYHLWVPSDLTNGGNNLTRILIHRIYCFAFSILFLTLGLLFFERKSTEGIKARGRLSGNRWAILVAAVSGLIVVITGLIIRNAG